MGTYRKVSGITWIATAVLLTMATGCNSQSAKPLWEPTTWPGKPNLPRQAAENVPVRYVRFDLTQLKSEETKRIEFPLPEGGSIPIVKVRDEQLNGDGFVWSGKVEGDEGSIVTLSILKNVLVGDIVTAGSMYRMGQVDAHVQIIYKLDRRKFPREAPPQDAIQYHRMAPPIARAETMAACIDDRIEVMVLYTEAACVSSFEGSTTSGNQMCTNVLAGLAMQARIQQAVEEANTVFANSLTSPRIRLIHVAHTGEYSEAALLSHDLMRLKYSPNTSPSESSKTGESTTYLDNFIETTSGVRDQYGADVVSLITQSSNRYPGGGAACGESTLLRRKQDTWFQKDAFTVVPVDCMTGNLSFVHELGHIMGANHESIDSNVSHIPDNRARVRMNPSSGDPWATVMAPNICERTDSNPGCGRIPYFSSSNSNLKYHGDPIGTDDPGNDGENNSGVVHDTEETVINFRPIKHCQLN